MKAQGPRHTADNGPIYCRHCGRVATYQLVYDLNQVGHLLRKNRGQVQTMLRDQKLKFRYELKTGWAVRRVVDHFQIWDYIDNHLPRPEDLESPQLNPTMRAIKRILGWNSDGQRQARATMERKRAEKQGQQTGSET